MTLVLGVDGGGSKTHAVVTDELGTVRGFSTAGPSNWEAAGLRGAADALREGSTRALEAASGGLGQLDAAAFGLAGLDWASDEPRLRGVLDEFGLPAAYVLVNDAFVALRAGTPEPHGVVLVAGTGAIAGGRNRAGQTYRTLGQGAGLGDVGSASDVSEKAVRAVADAYTGRGPTTVLTEELCSLGGCHSALEFLEQYSRGIEPPRSAAPLVMRAAEAGDDVARSIVEWAGAALGESAALVARHLDMLDDEFDVVLSGGLFRAGNPLLMDAISRALHPHAPRARPVVLQVPPVVGSVLLALDSVGIALDPERRRALDAAATDAVRKRAWVEPA